LWKHTEISMHSVSCLIPASNTQNWAWAGKNEEDEENKTVKF
jgi:hypothetical protein